MPGTQPSPETVQEAGKKRFSRRLGDLLSKPWWAGISGVLAVLGLLIAYWQINQPAAQPSATAIHFNNLSKMKLWQDGVVFYYPSDWDLQDVEDLTINGDAGIKYIDPDDANVSITEYGKLAYGKGGTLNFFPDTLSIDDVKKQWMSTSLPTNSKIIGASQSGVTVEDGNATYPVDGWRIEYQYVADQGDPHPGISMTDMVKTTIANGREIDLDMEAPTSEFERYKEAFLELGDKLLLLAKCGICSTK